MRNPYTAFSATRPQLWPRAGSILISFAAVALLMTALAPRFLSGTYSSVLLTLVLIALCVAIGLHVHFLLLARREHRDTAGALDTSELEYKSIFENTLDGILILDDQGVCLQANPAALNLFGFGHEELVGESLGRLFASAEDFAELWQGFIDRQSERRETRMLRRDGETIFVEYTARANYLPGRHLAVLRDVTRRKQAEEALRESEERFRQMASNIQEIFWMLDAESKNISYVNPAYETLTGRSCESLRKDPKSYQDAIHPEDRVRVLSRLDEAVQTGQLDEEFRIITPGKATRWVWIRGFPVRDAVGRVRRLVGTALDISARKAAEEEIAHNLDLAESARAEADAFQRTTLALTQDLSMDYVLDTLLQSLVKLVPCASARVLLVEANTRLFLAREVQSGEVVGRVQRSPETLDARDSRFLLEVLAANHSSLIPETAGETDWAGFRGFSHLSSWLCVPLVASQQVIGLLSLGDTRPHAFTPEHLRLAKSLAIPAAVAIQNARLYERAEIFRAELEHRLADLETI